MSYEPTGPYPPDPNHSWQQPPQPGYPVSAAPGYPTSGGGYPPPPPYGGYQQPPPKKSYLGLIIALVAGILVVGCGGTVAVLAIVGSKPGTHASSTGAPVTTDGGGTTTTTDSGPVPFGPDHGVQWSDKLEASVVSVARFTPSSTAAGTHPGQVGIKVTVKITNNSAKQFDLTLVEVKVKTGDNGTQADSIFDTESNLGIGFEGSIAPGHSATATYGFSVPPGELSKIDIDVTPNFDDNAGIFEGSVR